MARKFEDPTLRQQYEFAMQCFITKHNDFFYPNGERRTGGSYGNSFAQWFWLGFDGNVRFRWNAPSRKILGYAYFCAGQDAKKLIRNMKTLNK